IANWFDDVVTAQHHENENEPEPEGANFVRLYINDFGQDAFHQKVLSSRVHARDLRNTGHVNGVGKLARCAHDGDAWFFFHAANTSASRPGVMPAFMCDCRSWGRDLNQASVSRAV